MKRLGSMIIQRVVRWASGHWALLGALLILLVYLSTPYLVEEGLEAVNSHADEVALNLILHLTIIRFLVPAALILVVAVSTLWRASRHTRAVHAVRLAPSASLAAAAAGVTPPGRLFLLADERPFAACLGLWRPAIYVSSGLVEAVSPAALRAALTHEEGHRRARDPLRLLAVRAVVAAVTPLPWLEALAGRVALRAEIRADRFARRHSSTPALAEALLAVLGANMTAAPLDAPRWLDRAAAADLSGGMLLGAGLGAASDFDLRLRYLHLPQTTPLPAVLPPDLTLATILHGLAQVVLRGIIGRRGHPLTLAMSCLLPCAESFGPVADSLAGLLHVASVF